MLGVLVLFPHFLSVQRLAWLEEQARGRSRAEAETEGGTSHPVSCQASLSHSSDFPTLKSELLNSRSSGALSWFVDRVRFWHSCHSINSRRRVVLARFVHGCLPVPYGRCSVCICRVCFFTNTYNLSLSRKRICFVRAVEFF